MTPPTTDPFTALGPALFTAAVVFVIYGARQLHIGLTQTHEQQVRTEAQRLMLHFCKNPTQKRFEAAWRYIEENDVWVSELDQPLVQRFNSMVGSVNIK